MSKPNHDSRPTPDDATRSEATRDSAERGHSDFHSPDDLASSVEKIDRYIIEGVLGQGGFGVVFLATDPRLERRVAIKMPRVDKAVDEFVWQQFVDEGRAVANLKHDAIIQVFDIDRRTMEFLMS